MGYSCAAVAGIVMDKLVAQLQKDGGVDEHNSSNTWKHKGVFYMEERGRENSDGAVTGTISRFVGPNSAKRIGSYRIEPNGEITRFATSSAKQRAQAVADGVAEFQRIYHRP
jgi:hypothetical protein